MNSTFLSSIIGGAVGSLITVFGTYFIPLLQENRKEKKRKKEIIEPRRQRLLLLLKEQIDSNGQINFPTYEIGQLCAAVGLSESDCKDLLVTIGAWGNKTPGYTNRNLDIYYHEYWSLNSKSFYDFKE